MLSMCPICKLMAHPEQYSKKHDVCLDCLKAIIQSNIKEHLKRTTMFKASTATLTVLKNSTKDESNG